MGCAAIVCCVHGDALTVANAGDSRAVLCRGGRAVELSEDHKPELPWEERRIRRAGGWIEERRRPGQQPVFRVNGKLSLSRAIGDLDYKQNRSLPPSAQLISATPEVRTVKRLPDDEFVLLACDGIWDVIGSQNAVDFVRVRLRQLQQQRTPRADPGYDARELAQIMEQLLDACVSPDLEETQGLGGDNMTAVLVVFAKTPAKAFVAPQVAPPRPWTVPQREASVQRARAALLHFPPVPGAGAPVATPQAALRQHAPQRQGSDGMGREATLRQLVPQTPGSGGMVKEAYGRGRHYVVSSGGSFTVEGQRSHARLQQN